MKKTRKLRIVSVILLALVFLGVTLDLLISGSDDNASGRVAVCFIPEDRMFPQMDFHQLFSSEDIASYFVVGDEVSYDDMKEILKEQLSRHDSALLVCEGKYSADGLKLSQEESAISDLILISPDLDIQTDLGEIGTTVPSCRVGIFSTSRHTSDVIYERLSGEDTRFTRGTRSDSNAPELFISADARRYYARTDNWKDSSVAPSLLLNSPIMQTYLSNYCRNYVLEKDGISRAPLGIWAIKLLSTVVLLVAFFLYAATLPKHKKIVVEEDEDSESLENAPVPAASSDSGESANLKSSASSGAPAPMAHSAAAGAGSSSSEASLREPSDPDLPRKDEPRRELPRNKKGKLRGRSITQRYRSACAHLLALQLFLGLFFALGSCFLIVKKSPYHKTVLLVWMCLSLLSSAFYLLGFLRHMRDRKVRKNRSMWPLHLVFTLLLAADIFLLQLLWKGNGFLKLNLLLLVAILLSIMVMAAIVMLQLTDDYYGRSQGNDLAVLDSLKFSAIRFVPMVIVFFFSVIIGREIYAVRVIILLLSLIGASYLRRVVKKGALGDLFSVILYACLYWMMF